MLMFELPFQIPPILIEIYGPENPNRVWYILMTICVLMLFFRNYRRFGSLSFLFLLGSMFVWNYLQDMYKQFTPSGP
ncbi:MAG: hypothetical protein OHK0029_35920 [Armatimonadaceae bacterium]